ncbi:unnamed protein product [Vitrella brassicaformis CCMP3155]|uniref:PARP-type domain-containing protein n=2 Tax=Vitrella brassicaformis TaxID=1169539 RepID=A0A0G4EZX9_VITBC|nr:unnamed protein product [Vitrella brassicaformis CCMP3155]|mmetsp:Transcript_49591/g.124345  ORF Transcript_49591/g.124345 Transcript_49591/m.124345 type:complete len:172 (+) Transcript_49591:224-739(+)|eukprot:CEM04611.1 unnamed protein product [Vitrella brassicaformis CCMP3155]
MEGDYWTVSTGVAVRNGHMCRECRGYIMKGETMIVRDGRKIRLFYHPECFSGDADPRTQTTSSYCNPKYNTAISSHAPATKGYGKWSTSYGYSPSFSVSPPSSLLLPTAKPSKSLTTSFSRRESLRRDSGAPRPKTPKGEHGNGNGLAASMREGKTARSKTHGDLGKRGST